MANILDVTEKAQSYIKNLMQEPANTGKGLRISIIGGGCSGLSYKLDFDTNKSTDHVIKIENVEIFIDPKSSIYLNGTILDYQDGLQGKGFIFRNPNATNSCGCGESFSV